MSQTHSRSSLRPSHSTLTRWGRTGSRTAGTLCHRSSLRPDSNPRRHSGTTGNCAAGTLLHRSSCCHRCNCERGPCEWGGGLGSGCSGGRGSAAESVPSVARPRRAGHLQRCAWARHPLHTPAVPRTLPINAGVCVGACHALASPPPSHHQPPAFGGGASHSLVAEVGAASACVADTVQSAAAVPGVIAIVRVLEFLHTRAAHVANARACRAGAGVRTMLSAPSHPA